MGGDVELADPRQFFHIGAQFHRPQGTVQPHGNRPGVAQRVVERLGGLAGQRPAGGVGDGPGDHHRQIQAFLVAVLIHGEHRRFGIEGVEDGFDQNQIDAAFHQAVDGVEIGRHQPVKVGVAVARVVNVRADAGRAVGGAQHAGHEARALRRGDGVRRAARHPGGGHIDVPCQILHIIVRHGDGGTVEGVGLDDIGAGVQIITVQLFDHLRLGDAQQVVIALQVGRPIRVLAAAVLRFGELQALDHRAHTAVENDDAFPEEGGELFAAVRGHARLHRCVARGKPGCALYRLWPGYPTWQVRYTPAN